MIFLVVIIFASTPLIPSWDSTRLWEATNCCAWEGRRVPDLVVRPTALGAGPRMSSVHYVCLLQGPDLYSVARSIGV